LIGMTWTPYGLLYLDRTPPQASAFFASAGEVLVDCRRLATARRRQELLLHYESISTNEPYKHEALLRDDGRCVHWERYDAFPGTRLRVLTDADGTGSHQNIGTNCTATFPLRVGATHTFDCSVLRSPVTLRAVDMQLLGVPSSSPAAVSVSDAARDELEQGVRAGGALSALRLFADEAVDQLDYANATARATAAAHYLGQPAMVAAALRDAARASGRQEAGRSGQSADGTTADSKYGYEVQIHTHYCDQMDIVLASGATWAIAVHLFFSDWAQLCDTYTAHDHPGFHTSHQVRGRIFQNIYQSSAAPPTQQRNALAEQGLLDTGCDPAGITVTMEQDLIDGIAAAAVPLRVCHPNEPGTTHVLPPNVLHRVTMAPESRTGEPAVTLFVQHMDNRAQMTKRGADSPRLHTRLRRDIPGLQTKFLAAVAAYVAGETTQLQLGRFFDIRYDGALLNTEL
jgi:hypothetical protein